MVGTDCGEAFTVRSGDRSAVAGGAGVVEPGDPADGETTGEIGWVDQQRHRLGVLVVGDVGVGAGRPVVTACWALPEKEVGRGQG